MCFDSVGAVMNVCSLRLNDVHGAVSELDQRLDMPCVICVAALNVFVRATCMYDAMKSEEENIPEYRGSVV